ncbi:MAG: PKD domain-containing protein [Bacteroidota bacterium]
MKTIKDKFSINQLTAPPPSCGEGVKGRGLWWGFFLLLFFSIPSGGSGWATASYAQTATTFMRTYKAIGMNGGLALAETSDGGFVGTGQHQSSGAGSCDIYVYKVNSCGYPQWFKTYGGISDDGGMCIQQTSDGGYIVAGLSTLGAGDVDIILLKLDAFGNVVWSKVFGGGTNDYGLYVQQTSDGGYIVTGFMSGLGFGAEDVALIRTDTNGNLLWQKEYGGAGSEWGSYVEQTSDGGYKIAGYTNSFGAGGFDLYVLKVDGSGNLQWSKTYGGVGAEGSSQWGISGKITTDGGFMLCGNTTTYGAGGNDVMMIKTDSMGNLQWAKTYGGGLEEQPRSSTQTSDAGFIISGYTTSFGAGDLDAYLIKTDSMGNLLWSKAYGGAAYDKGSMVRQAPDGGYALSVVTASFGANFYDPLFMKTDSVGYVGCNENNCATVFNNISPSVGSGGNEMIPPAAVAIPAIITSNYTPADIFLCLKCSILPTFTQSNITACIGNTNYFYNTSNPGKECTEWFVNNISQGYQDTLSVIFTTPGLQKIQLVASCGNSTDTNTVALNILAYNAPVASFINNTVCNGDTTQFTDFSTFANDPISTWSWNFGDGSPLNFNQNPGYNYPNPGTYNVKLTVTTTNGCTDTSVQTMLVHSTPNAQFDSVIVCRGDTVQFQDLSTIIAPDSIQTWAWNFGDGSLINIDQNPIHNFITSSTYNVSLLLVSNHGCKDSITNPIIINPPLLAESGFGNDTLCTGGTILLGGSPTAFGGLAPFTYAWSPVTGLSSSTISNPTATITANIGYMITVTDVAGCQDIDSVFILYNSTGPFVDAGFGSDTICSGGITMLGGAPTGSGGLAPYTYSWSPSIGLNNPTSSNPTATITANTTYVVTISDGNGCQNIDSVFLAYNSSGPFADAGFGNNTLCTGGTIMLGGTPTGSGGIGPYTYSWVPGAGLTTTTAANPTATITSNSTYVVIVTDASGCQNLDSVFITFNSAGPFADAGFGNNTLCTSGTILLGGAPTGYGGTASYSYVWTPATGLNNTLSSNPTATVTSNATYAVIVTDGSGCQNIDSVTVLYNSNGPFADAGFGNSTLCTGGTILLGGAPTGTGGVSPYTYSWIPGAGLNSTIFSNPTATITANASFVVIITDAIGCQNLDSVFLTFNSAGPFAEAGFGNNTLCTGGTILLGGAPTGTGGVSPYTYSWVPNTGLNSTIISNPTASMTSNSIYVIMVTDATGCQNLDSVFITYNSNGPHAEAGFGNNNLCTGGTVLLGGSPTATNGIAPYSYSWIPSTGLNNITFANPTATITANATYAVIVTDNGGCQDIDSVSVLYNANGPHAEAGFGNNTLCTGGTLLLGGTPTVAGGTAPYIYSWIPSNGLNNTSVANPFATVTANITYVIMVTDVTGCQDIDSVAITFNAAGPFADAGSGNGALCFSYPMPLGGSPSGSQGTLPYSYSWVPAAGLNNAILANPTANSVTTNTVYYLTVTDAGGCTDLDSANVTILGTGLTANFSASPSQGIDPLFVQFTNQSVGYGLTYQWLFGDNGTSIIENPNHTFYNSADTAFNFFVTLVATDTNGCIDTAILTAVHVDPTNINTYPNVFTPNDDGVNDVFKFDLGSLTLLKASIFSRWGEKMVEWSTPVGGWDGRTASGVMSSDGVYFFILTVMDGAKKTLQKTGYVFLTR